MLVHEPLPSSIATMTITKAENVACSSSTERRSSHGCVSGSPTGGGGGRTSSSKNNIYENKKKLSSGSTEENGDGWGSVKTNRKETIIKFNKSILFCYTFLCYTFLFMHFSYYTISPFKLQSQLHLWCFLIFQINHTIFIFIPAPFIFPYKPIIIFIILHPSVYIYQLPYSL